MKDLIETIVNEKLFLIKQIPYLSRYNKLSLSIWKKHKLLTENVNDDWKEVYCEWHLKERLSKVRLLEFFSLKDTLKPFEDFKYKQKSVWCNAFCYVKKYVYSESLLNTLYVEIKNKCWKNSFGQNKQYKKCPLFLSRAPTHHGFTFNLRFLYELKHKIRLYKTVCGIFHFRFRLVF